MTALTTISLVSCRIHRAVNFFASSCGVSLLFVFSHLSVAICQSRHWSESESASFGVGVGIGRSRSRHLSLLESASVAVGVRVSICRCRSRSRHLSLSESESASVAVGVGVGICRCLSQHLLESEFASVGVRTCRSPHLSEPKSVGVAFCWYCHLSACLEAPELRGALGSQSLFSLVKSYVGLSFY